MKPGPLLPWFFVVALAGCAATVGPFDVSTDSAVDVPSVGNWIDAIPVRDSYYQPDAPPGCSSPASCGSDRPPSVYGLASSAWSCVVNSCAWEYSGDRRCTVDGAGCVTCQYGSNAIVIGCPRTQQCQYTPFIGPSHVVDSTCARTFVSEIVDCYGNVARLSDGTYCTFEEIPTWPIRAVLACGGCQVLLI